MKKRKPVFTKAIQLLICLLIGISVIGLLLGQVLVSNYRNNAFQSSENAIRKYVEIYNNTFSQLNQELQYLAMSDSNIQRLSERDAQDTPEQALIHHNLEKMRVLNRLNSVANVYGTQYSIWVYDTKSGSLVNYGKNDYASRMEFYRQLQEQIDSGELTVSKSGQWYVSNNQYLCTAFHYRNIYIGAWLCLQDYVQDIVEQDFASFYSVELRDKDGIVLQALENREGKIQSREDEVSKGLVSYTFSVNEMQSEVELDFSIRQNWYENGNLLQVVIVVMALAVLIAVLLFAVYVKNRILQPILQFYNQIVDGDGKQAFEISEQAVELDKAAELLNHLSEEVQNLQLKQYRQQIQIQKAELGFAQQQIRPHFFLNCLNVIYSMAQLNQKENVQEMCVNISEYLRLLLGCNSGFLPLKKELELTESYLQITQKVYGQTFGYRIERDCEIEEVEVPPLMIQTFVENSIKYGEKEAGIFIQIGIHKCIQAEDERLCVEIQDNGVGFDEKILQGIQDGTYQSMRNGYQIGIGNIRQRMDLLYHGNYHMEIGNNETGAIVKIDIPMNRSEKRVET